ncbi:cytochrome-c oxidase chain VIIc [Ascosphaera apis ARSEF 7405]|uniref:Cytochrome c oxidase subunit 8, mitochondrial n=1 Tax=Ascosphaera apis ARSEF 7405 TaxID=392613 RepID=A0A168DRS9_9EURO|nr:cytochrome-c oxidase chain VIIc [Ascosphaera apis ARSEF 7405]
MFARSVARANLANSVARRGFSTTRAQLSGHYPEGPRSNIPFNPMSKFFFLRYWGFMAVGFGAPFAIAVWQTKKNK